MKVGIFWLGRASAEIDLALRVFSGRSERPMRLHLVTRDPRPGSQALSRDTNRHAYDTINDLEDVFLEGLRSRLDYAVVSFGNGVPTSLHRLRKLLESRVVSEVVWSFRVAPITGAGFRHSPRLPLVDDHFIVLNVARATERRFFDRHLIHGCHFASGGGRHAHLASMIEYSVEHGEFHNHFAADASTDHHGRQVRFDAVPYHVCTETGFATCYSAFMANLLPLLAKNLGDVEAGSFAGRSHFFRRGDFWYLRPLLDLDGMMYAVKSRLDLGRYSFKKKYEGEI